MRERPYMDSHAERGNEVNYQNWKADEKGIDKTFFADGSIGETSLNEVNWESMGANVGLRYQF